MGLPNDIAVFFAGHAAGQRSGTPRDARSTTTRAARAFETRVHATRPVVPRRGRLYLQPRSPDEHEGVSISSSSTETGKRRRMRAKRPVQGKRLFLAPQRVAHHLRDGLKRRARRRYSRQQSCRDYPASVRGARNRLGRYPRRPATSVSHRSRGDSCQTISSHGRGDTRRDWRGGVRLRLRTCEGAIACRSGRAGMPGHA